MKTTKYKKLYAVPVERIGELTWYEGTAEWGEGSPKLSKHAGFDLSSVSVNLSLGYDSSCEIHVIGAIDSSKQPAVTIQDADSLYIENLMKEFRYGRRFNVYQDINDTTMLLFSGFVFSAGSGVASSTQSMELGFKVTLASAAKLYDNSYIKNPGYYTLTSSSNTSDGPIRLDAKLAVTAGAKQSGDGGSATQPETVDSILQSADNRVTAGGNTTCTNIAKLYQRIIDLFTSKHPTSTDIQPLKLDQMFDIDNSCLLKSEINVLITLPAGKGQSVSAILRSFIVGPIVNNLPNNSAVAVFCNALSQFYMTVAPRVDAELNKNLVILPATGFGISDDNHKISNSDVISYTRYAAQRAPNSLVNIWVYDNNLLSSNNSPTTGAALVALQGEIKDTGELFIKLDKDPLTKKPTESGKEVSIGPIQSVQLPTWGLKAPQEQGNKDQSNEYKYNFAESLATTMFASSGMVADNMVMTLSYEALGKVLNGVGCIYELDTLLPGGNVGDAIMRPLTRILNRVRNPKYYGRLKQLSFQFSCTGERINTQVQCTFDNVLRESEYKSLVVGTGKLNPKNMLLYTPERIKK